MIESALNMPCYFTASGKIKRLAEVSQGPEKFYIPNSEFCRLKIKYKQENKLVLCTICGDGFFEIQRHGRKYCSNACKQKAFRERNR